MCRRSIDELGTDWDKTKVSVVMKKELLEIWSGSTWKKFFQIARWIQQCDEPGREVEKARLQDLVEEENTVRSCVASYAALRGEEVVEDEEGDGSGSESEEG